LTNFLSPVDPIFFLHHSNMDRLWDVWTRKQERIGKPILPDGTDLQTLSNEPFLFYVNGNGQFVGNSQAGEYLSTKRFDYQYQPGFPENVLQQTISTTQKRLRAPVRGTIRGNTATLAIPSATVQEHLAAPAGTLVAEITVRHPSPSLPTREFHVLVGAPADLTDASPSSPYFAGTVSFFGNMTHTHDTMGSSTFAVPLPKAPQAFKALGATNATVNIRIVPAKGHTQAPPLIKSATVRSL
jgi:tyrosinase